MNVNFNIQSHYPEGRHKNYSLDASFPLPITVCLEDDSSPLYPNQYWSSNGLVPKKLQTITWTNDHSVWWSLSSKDVCGTLGYSILQLQHRWNQLINHIDNLHRLIQSKYTTVIHWYSRKRNINEHNGVNDNCNRSNSSLLRISLILISILKNNHRSLTIHWPLIQRIYNLNLFLTCTMILCWLIEPRDSYRRQ